LARRKEKEERLQARREYQETRKAHFEEKTYHFRTLLDLMERGIQQLCMEVDSPALRTRRLNRYLGRNLKSLHPDSVALIEQV
jgi:flagellar motor switch protein FliG